ncbi:MAG: hypothetical protein ABEJ30_03215 [Halorientalis sp.]
MGYSNRIRALARRAASDVAAFDPPADPPDDARATTYLREGFGPAVALYVEARTGPGQVPFTEADLSTLEAAMNDWLGLYCRCYGTDFDPEFTVREAAELLVETHDARDVAQLLTDVPARHGGTRPAAGGRGREQN